MQIRKQLRKMAFSFARIKSEYSPCCLNHTCKTGYHGVLQRTRWKARSRNHGNSTGQSKHAGK